MAVTVKKLSRSDLGAVEVGLKPTDKITGERLLQPGQLYELDDGTIVVAVFARDLNQTRMKEHSSRRWQFWSLPDYAPNDFDDLASVYYDDWFVDDEDHVTRDRADTAYLLAPPKSEPFNPARFDPTQWGGKPEAVPTGLDDPRIVAVVPKTDGDDEQFVVVRLKDVPEGAKRGGASISLDKVIKGEHDAGRIGAFTGPNSDVAKPDEFVRIQLRDLPAATRPEVKIEAAPDPKYKFGNSGRTYSFEAGTNSFTRELGWKPLDLTGDGKGPSFDPVAPVMAVHDLMEHFPGDEYEPHNEYMAQGAMLWLRAEGGFFGANSVADTVMRPAFGMLFHHINNGKLDTKEVSILPAAEQNALIHHGMSASTFFLVNELAFKAKEFIKQNYSYNDQKNRLENSVVRGVPWMLVGYKRAQQRYSGLNRSKLVALYKDTVEQISRVKPGAKLKLTMNYDKYSADIEISTSSKG